MMMRSLTLRLTITLTFLAICWGAIHESVSDLPDIDYDFVIVGGGAAGNVIANRLTENPHFTVLVLEAGVSNEGVFDAIVPFLLGNLLENPLYSWNYTTMPQQGLNGRSFEYSRGHILGGCTSHNWMIYTRGSSDDFDRYAKITGDPGWSWNQLQPYIRKNERLTPPADHHDTKGQFDPSVHSTSGIVSVSLTGFSQPIDERVIQTTVELSEEFPFNLDTNSGKPLGLSWTQTTIKGGKRSSSATSYLGPQFIKRPNLHVLLNARVTRVLNTNPEGSKPAFKAVEFLQDMKGPRFRIQASKEVILSAGSIGTPHILLLSGIGDKVDLAATGVTPLLHLPSVGKNLSDQPALGNTWFVKSTDTFETIIRNATLLHELVRQWNHTHAGPMVSSAAGHLVWQRLPPNASIFEKYQDPSAGPNTPHIELLVSNGQFLFDVPTHGNTIGLGSIVVTPVGRGSVTLNTTNPFDQPLIDFGLLNNDFDMFAMRTAIKNARRFVSAPVWKDYVLGPTEDLAKAKTDADLDEYIRNNAQAAAHSVGSASMSAKDAGYGVVHPDLRVKGAAGLRIVDASVLPFVPSGHTQAPVYIIAERAADLIKEAWK